MYPTNCPQKHWRGRLLREVFSVHHQGLDCDCIVPADDLRRKNILTAICYCTHKSSGQHKGLVEQQKAKITDPG